MSLAPSDFRKFVAAVHGYEPFPWQERLLATVLEKGWPRTIGLPTASGKTSVLDVAVFALALQSPREERVRTLPIRTALVVDRRIVVDGAFERASRICSALEDAHGGILCDVRNALQSYGAEVPLRSALLRGGIYREDRWAREPNQPAILCSTVDQVGSRLLHRGYGLSSRVAPIHAGLLGEDTLIVLDEAHCSVPFGETLTAIDALRARAERPIQRPWAFVEMTATVRPGAVPFELDSADMEHPVLCRRLNASKPIDLRGVEKSGRAGTVSALVDATRSHATEGKTVLCVVNRVATARAVQGQLASMAQKKKNSFCGEVVLLTGRSRPIERDALLRRYADRLLTGRDRAAVDGEPALVVVATQCVEVGADLDADALVTEAAPLDSLRQRLGRLDRAGELGEAPCVVVCPGKAAWDGTGDPPDDPIYGTAVAETWHLLGQWQDASRLDGAPLAFGDLARTAPAQCLAPASSAPLIFPAYCDLWAQTGPQPAESPEPALFLHGPDTSSPDVQLVFRADLDDLVPERWVDAMALCPPVAPETLPVRMSVARAWLEGQDTRHLDDSGDVDAQSVEKPTKHPTDEGSRVALRWRGPEDSAVVEPSGIRPGDVLVVPVSYGGCDTFGWAPDSIDPVVDLADSARLMSRRAPSLRIVDSLISPDDGPGSDSLRSLTRLAVDEVPEDLDARIDEAMTLLEASTNACAPIAAALRADGRWRAERHPSGRGLVVIGRAGWAEGARDFTDEDAGSSRAPATVELDVHLRDTGALAERFGRGSGLPSDLVADLALAGTLHDLGKADPRFQAWLHDGSRLAARRSPLLAKSPRVATGRAAREIARSRAGYPRGGRHELLSVRLAETSEELLSRAHDRDLVLHLVASHHGHCRPFAPVVHDDRPVAVTVDFEGFTMMASSATGLENVGAGVPERFFGLLRRYGWWGLAYLEACLRLADHRASEHAEKGATP